MRDWRKVYQVWIQYSRQFWEIAFKSPCANQAADYARNCISYSDNGAMTRIELRDAFGTETLETIWDKDWKPKSST